MSIRKVIIDKTSHIEEMLADHLAICLSGLPGVGKKTAVRKLLEKHPEVNAVFCTVPDIEDGSALSLGQTGKVNWYLVQRPENDEYPSSSRKFWEFIHRMPKTDRIFLAVNGVMPDVFLEFVWNGIMAEVLPETFWFTETEIYRYLKACHSELRYREVQYLTGGWAGCIAMLVRLEKQLRDRWTAWELGSRYEIRLYIQRQILDALPEDELRMLRERTAFPSLNRELVDLLWPEPERELEERLLARGAMIYVPEKNVWHVQPALRMAIGQYASVSLCEKAIAWYEEKGQIQNALECCWYLHDRRRYTECLIRNYDRIPFLHYEKTGSSGRNRRIAELLYLEWMEKYLHQDQGGMAEIREKLEYYISSAVAEGTDETKAAEIYLNIAYCDPELTAEEWMQLLKEKTEPGRPVRLYFMLGESVSYLSGIRDLSALFSCGRSERSAYRKLWEERLAEENQMPYRLAELEYEFQINGPLMKKGSRMEILPDIHQESMWQVKLGMMYLAFLICEEKEQKENIRNYIYELADGLSKEENAVCRWNSRALRYLADARQGEKEGVMKWIRETGGDIENESGKTCFYMAAEVKINLYLGNFSKAGSLLNILIPYFETNHSWRWLAEALFQRAIVEREKGETAQALKTVAESLGVSNPYRYVQIYIGYGRMGADLLEEYRSWMKKQEASNYQRKKKYKYGSVLRMPVSDWVDYIVRKAGRQKKYYLDLKEEQQNIYRIEKLTVTEQMVLQYLEKGYSNAEISEAMNVKLPTVKTHIYNIYKKLDVTTRVQAVQKIRESGIL